MLTQKPTEGRLEPENFRSTRKLLDNGRRQAAIKRTSAPIDFMPIVLLPGRVAIGARWRIRDSLPANDFDMQLRKGRRMTGGGRHRASGRLQQKIIVSRAVEGLQKTIGLNQRVQNLIAVSPIGSPSVIAGCEFKDERLGRRFGKLPAQIGSDMGQSIPLVCHDWANTQAAYRFLSNERVNEADILSGHFEATRTTMQSW
ncbi:transposase DNA-binding-containing protein [Bradyrhizobium sp. CCGUVB23]|uniref:IS4/Tn5 family transposase DNA-binding protein n=1 Tax=Bradyrhizobium sp. CCGUVB23 TaxID=2949630 RepID=UPI0020B1FBE8|nr:transposase DNA-binding-containing protein [Bradyrhizobium sp. CCGUVB23]MCP3463578.1 hypothetical protein [Bradyrhizobium sp. CCGUVB23]